MGEDDATDAADAEELPEKPAGEQCNARKRAGDGYCKLRAGHGTDHVGLGRCKFHGGTTPGQTKAIVDELEEAAEHGATALKLKLKLMLDALEDDDDVDAHELDRLARTVLDRTGYGKSETHEVDGDVSGDLTLNVEREVITSDDTDD